MVQSMLLISVHAFTGSSQLETRLKRVQHRSWRVSGPCVGHRGAGVELRVLGAVRIDHSHIGHHLQKHN